MSDLSPRRKSAEEQLLALDEPEFKKYVNSLTWSDIGQICRTSTLLRDRLCHNEPLLRSIYLKEFGHPEYAPKRWQDLLENPPDYSNLEVLSWGPVGSPTGRVPDPKLDLVYIDPRFSLSMPLFQLKSIRKVFGGINQNFAVDINGRLWIIYSNHIKITPEFLGRVEMVAQNSKTTYALNSDGVVWTWSTEPSTFSSEHATLRTSFRDIFNAKTTKDKLTYGYQITNREKRKYARVSGLSKIVSITTSDYNTLALDQFGNVWTLRSLIHDVDKSKDSSLAFVADIEPVQLLHLEQIIGLSTNNEGTVYLDSALRVWVGNTNIRSPIKSLSLPLIRSVIAGRSAFYFLDMDGKLWAYGSNDKGQLGIHEALFNHDGVKYTGVPQLIIFPSSKSEHDRSELAYDKSRLKLEYEYGGNNQDKSDNTRIIKVSTLGDTVMALDQRGQVWAWGDNSKGVISVINPSPIIDRPYPINSEHGLGYVVDIAVGLNSGLILEQPPLFLDEDDDRMVKNSTYRFLAPSTLPGESGLWYVQINSRRGKVYRVKSRADGFMYGQRY